MEKWPFALFFSLPLLMLLGLLAKRHKEDVNTHINPNGQISNTLLIATCNRSSTTHISDIHILSSGRCVVLKELS